jgi:hypothetical protein
MRSSTNPCRTDILAFEGEGKGTFFDGTARAGV